MWSQSGALMVDLFSYLRFPRVNIYGHISTVVS